MITPVEVPKIKYGNSGARGFKYFIGIVKRCQASRCDPSSVLSGREKDHLGIINNFYSKQFLFEISK